MTNPVKMLRIMLQATRTGLAIAVIGTAPCYAVDYQPGDYIPAPPTTNILMGYYEYGDRDELNNTITGTSKSGTGLESNTGILRYLYYNEDPFLNHPYLLEFLLPFGAFSNGKINGQDLNNASGVSDPLLSATYWPISQQANKFYFSISTYVSVPIGSYDNDKALNLGSNRWQNDLQLDITKGFLKKFTIDIAADWIYYGDNNDYGATHQTLKQNSSYNAYIWLSYDVTGMMQHVIPNASNAAVSIGYAGTFGGTQKVDGTDTGSKTEENQIRATYSQFVTPTWQVLISLNHDVNVTGQFKQNFGLLFRVAKVF